MVSRNDITGDAIKSKPANENYRNNFDAIFNKPKKKEPSDNKKEKEKK